MGPALPPAPPAIIMRVAPRAASRTFVPFVRTMSQADAIGIVKRARGERTDDRRNWATGFDFGSKTRGARDASLRSRSRRRKARG